MIDLKRKFSNFFILLTILAIIFYAYFISQNKGSIKIETTEMALDDSINNIERNITIFKDVEYKTTDIKNREYITRGKEAYVTKDKSELIKLKTVHSFTKLKDNTILNIKSEKADYYKNTKNIKYYQNVIITNKETVISANIANYFTKKNLIRLENNVLIKNSQNTIIGDIAELNTITNNLKIFMIKKKDKVYGKRNQTKN